MANQNDVNNFTAGVGIFASSGAGTIPLMYVPKNGGAITLKAVHLMNSVTATGTINAPVIIYMADASTPTMAGTLGTAALWTITGAGGSRTAVTLTTDYIQPGTADKWLGLSYTSGTVLAGAPFVEVSYIMGR